ncbi:MAG: SDR family NAD(P)-dependent oxidoreductase [Opitutaceae bacterium]|nr:SDR family NAD(P)-dependent oxidoreductase [Opitutaceae bacterium]
MVESREKVALVTGASSGIGEAIARRLLQRGWRVAMTARREERLVSLVKLLDVAGDRTLTLVGDVTSAADRQRWVQRTYERWGRIDALVNNAGYGQRGPIELVPVEAIRANFETNLFSLVALTQLVIPLMRGRGRGRIINVGSVAGRIARPFSSVYDATKHALNAVSDGLRGELRPFGIDVVVIQPGFITTEFVDAANKVSGEVIRHMGVYSEAWEAMQKSIGTVKRLAGRPDDIADLVERALDARHPRARYSGPKHAKLFLALKWLLPDRLFDRVFRVRRSP